MKKQSILTSCSFVFFFCFLMSAVTSAKEATPLVDDPVLEVRVMALSEELRCLVCQNQTVADSDADLAVDMRDEVRNKMKEGWSDDQIVDYLVDRYGNFVRYSPPLNVTTLLLWFGPALLLVLGVVLLFYSLRNRRKQASVMTSLSRQDQQRAQTLLSEEEGKK